MGRIRKYIVQLILLCVGATILPISARAEFLEIPPWQRLTINGEELACYDFESAKKLKEADVELHASKIQLQLSDLTIKLILQQQEINKEIIGKREETIVRLNGAVNRITQERDEAQEKQVAAESRDIIGAAFPWVIGVFLLGVVGGGVAAAALHL